ncbi:MAG: hypothetical protein DCC70_12160 [Burkholderiales bacterium]|nr:MAG: hypothetical protein DCC70_12160 [Burkholderiales bacterium]
MTPHVTCELRRPIARPARARQQEEPTLGGAELGWRQARASQHERDGRRERVDRGVFRLVREKRLRIGQRARVAHRHVGRDVLVQPFGIRLSVATHRARPSRAIDARARNGADPVAVGAPLPFERAAAEVVAARVQVDVAHRPRNVPLVALHFLRRRNRLPLELDWRHAPRAHAQAKRREHARERPQRAVALELREHVHVVRHQHARDEVEPAPEPRPQIGTREPVLEGPRAPGSARNEVQEFGLRHAPIMRGRAGART